MKDSAINILITPDESYFHLAVVALKSLFDTNKGEFHIHLFSNGLSDDKLQMVRHLLPQDRATLTVYDVSHLKEEIGLDITSEMPFSAYSRLFMASILPESIEKVLYLDCDIVIRDNIRELYDTPFEGALVCGVLDLVLSNTYRKLVGLPNGEPFINAGVQLVALKAWREEHLQQRIVDFIRTKNGKVFHHDEGVINAVCAGKKKIVPPRFNTINNYFNYPYKYMKLITPDFYTEQEYNEARNNPAIIHYTGLLSGRPWEEGCTHPFKKLYFDYQQQTVYKDRPLSPHHYPLLDRVTRGIYKYFPFVFYATFMKVIYALVGLKQKS